MVERAARAVVQQQPDTLTVKEQALDAREARVPEGGVEALGEGTLKGGGKTAFACGVNALPSVVFFTSFPV